METGEDFSKFQSPTNKVAQTRYIEHRISKKLNVYLLFICQLQNIESRVDVILGNEENANIMQVGYKNRNIYKYLYSINQL